LIFEEKVAACPLWQRSGVSVETRYPVCLGKENSNRLVSLWDIVNQFDVLRLALHVDALGKLHFKCALDCSHGVQAIDEGVYRDALSRIEEIQKFCGEVGFEESWRKARLSLERLKSPLFAGSASLASEAINIHDVLLSEVGARKFVVVSKQRSEFIDNPGLLGDDVARTFPSALLDIVEAGNCLAIESSTAVVFHVMRVAEQGLRALAMKLRVRLTDKGKPHPIELAQWDKIITGIKIEINKVRQRPKGSVKRQEQLELYSDAADHCTFMKDIWRNAASHARKPYTDPEAMAAFGRVREFMAFLATNSLVPSVGLRRGDVPA
jgi:hypothetical protein